MWDGSRDSLCGNRTLNAQGGEGPTHPIPPGLVVGGSGMAAVAGDTLEEVTLGVGKVLVAIDVEHILTICIRLQNLVELGQVGRTPVLTAVLGGIDILTSHRHNTVKDDLRIGLKRANLLHEDFQILREEGIAVSGIVQANIDNDLIVLMLGKKLFQLHLTEVALVTNLIFQYRAEVQRRLAEIMGITGTGIKAQT